MATEREADPEDENQGASIDGAGVRLADLRALYESISGWIRVADTKAGLQLTASGLVLGLVTDGIISDKSILVDVSDCTIALVVLSYSLLVLAVVANLLALGPRLKKVSPRDSLLYFIDIGSRSAEAFKAELAATPLERIKDQYAEQIHELAQIAASKFRRVQVATALILAAMASGALAWLVEGITAL